MSGKSVFLSPLLGEELSLGANCRFAVPLNYLAILGEPVKVGRIWSVKVGFGSETLYASYRDVRHGTTVLGEPLDTRP